MSFNTILIIFVIYLLAMIIQRVCGFGMGIIAVMIRGSLYEYSVRDQRFLYCLEVPGECPLEADHSDPVRKLPGHLPVDPVPGQCFL